MEFMETGEAKDLDVGCLERMVQPPFEKDPTNDRAANGGAGDHRGRMDQGGSTLILRGHQIDLVILKRHDKLPAPLESACRWLSFFPLIKSSLK